MEQPIHNLAELFRQLGLADDGVAIDAFIAHHRPLPADTALVNASFWSVSQRAFLKEAIIADADWCEWVDELSTRLR